MMQEIQAKAATIKLLVLDVDGVLTDGKLYFFEDGGEAKAFSTLDGHGIKMLRRSGVEVAIITGRTSKLVARRANDLGIQWLVQGREDKWQALQELTAANAFQPEQIAFVGDDLPDLTIMRRVGLGIAVATAHSFVAQHADWQTELSGGQGAVREVCDLIMQAQGTFDELYNQYL